MKVNHFIIIFLGLLLFFCSCLPKYAVDFQTVDFTNITLNKTDFNAKIWMSYKWFVPLTISDVKYKLFVNDYLIGEGRYPEKILLGKNADTLLLFPCTVNHKDIAGPLIDILLRGKFDYEVKVDFLIQIQDWEKRYNTTYKGTRRL